MVPTNEREVTIGGKAFKVMCGLGTYKVYEDEFDGKLEEPYTGVMEDDMLALWRTMQEKLDGKPNPEYRRSVDWEALTRFLWACCYSGGYTKKGFDDFCKELWQLPASRAEGLALAYVIVYEFGGGVIFRVPEGQGGEEVEDATEVAEG